MASTELLVRRKVDAFLLNLGELLGAGVLAIRVDVLYDASYTEEKDIHLLTEAADEGAEHAAELRRRVAESLRPAKRAPVDLTGEAFGRLTALRKVSRTGRDVMWDCVCTCGEETAVRQQSLLAGHTKSCGCLRREKIAIAQAASRGKGARSRGSGSTALTERALEKQMSRDADAKDLMSGKVTEEELKLQNGAFALPPVRLHLRGSTLPKRPLR